jgi:putative spermidine/putrescine transport system permease protein
MATLTTIGGTSALARTARRRFRPAALPLWWVIPPALYLVVFFVFPLFDNGLRSLHPGGAGAWSLAYYVKLLTDAYYLSVIGQTLALSVGVTAICIVLGYPAAYFLVRHSGRWASLVIFLLIAPQLTSIIMRTFGWRVLFARLGLVNTALIDLGLIDKPLPLLQGPTSVVIGLVHVFVPFMVLSIASVLQGIDRRLEESARILGASKLQAFLRITLPLSLDGVGTGSILVFMLTNGSFVTLLLLGGGSVVTMPVLIYQQFNLTQDIGFAAAMGNLLLVIALGCLYLQLRLIKRRGVQA